MKPDGTEYIPLGEYDEIVSAGNIGWLAKKDGKQYLMVLNYSPMEQRIVLKAPVVDMDTEEMEAILRLTGDETGKSGPSK